MNLIENTIARATAREFGLDPDTTIDRSFVATVCGINWVLKADPRVITPTQAQIFIDRYQHMIGQIEMDLARTRHPAFGHLLELLRAVRKRLVDAWGEVPDPNCHQFTEHPKVYDSIFNNSRKET